MDILYHDLIKTKNNAERCQSLQIRELWGKGGYGKSELAIEFAHRFRSHFSLIWTIQCDTAEHIEQSYRLLAERLILDSKEPLEKLKAKVHLTLETFSFGLPWLLIFDNVEEKLLDCPPQRGGAILVTSQKRILNPEFILEILPFTHDESIELLEKITNEKRGEDLELLAKDLEGIPLLLNYAAHYIKATPGYNSAAYHQYFTSQFFKEEGPLWKEMDVNRRYLKSLSTSWQFPLKSLEKECPLALEWLYICSYLHAEQIYENWIDDWLNERTQSPVHIMQREKKEILRELRNYGIIRYEEKTQTFSLHRFFQQMIRDSRKNQVEKDLSQTIALLAKHGNDYRYSESSSWKQGYVWYLHACEAKKWLETYSLQLSNRSFQFNKALFYEGIGEWCVFNEAYTEALEVYKMGLALKKTIFDKNSPLIGSAYEKIAWACVELARYPEALSNCAEAEKIQCHLLEDGALDYANTLHTKGLTLCRQGKDEEAIDCHKMALKIRLENLHINSSDLEKNFTHIVQLVNKIGKETDVLKKAERYKESIALHEKVVDVGRSLYCISTCYQNIGQLSKAIEFNERSLEIYQKNCGNGHPLSIRALERRAYNLIFLGKYRSALKLYKQAIALHLHHRGKEHADLTYSWTGVGWCYFHQNKYKPALRAFKKAIKLGLEPLGEKAFIMLRAYKGLGWTYLKKGRTEKGLMVLTKHLHICSRIFKNTPKMVQDLEDFQKAVQEASIKDEKAEYVRQAVIEAYKISQETLGNDHPLSRAFQEEKNR